MINGNRLVAGLAIGAMALAGGGRAADAPALNPRLAKIEPNQWMLLHEQKPEDAVRFKLQEHGGGCFDSKRGRILLFGSNTHGKDWCNSPLIFDVAKETWTRLYPNDGKETYTTNSEGMAVAGANRDHPWAMHTFGAVDYDPKRDEMVVSSWPGHMTPGRFSDALKDVWGLAKVHPTWTFRLAEEKWVPLSCKPIHFFPYATAYDSDRGVIIGYGGVGVAELGGEPREWKKILGGPKFGWHNNAVYDTKNKALVVFGSNQNSDEIVVYRPETKEHVTMPTAGGRPPKDQHNPMAFDESIGRTVVVVDREIEPKVKTEAEAWLYDLGSDSWLQLKTATLPFGCGMSYNLYYDPNHKVNLLVAQTRGKFGTVVSVFALKIELPGK